MRPLKLTWVVKLENKLKFKKNNLCTNPKSSERERGGTAIKVWLALREFRPSLRCPETPALCLVNRWVWHTEPVDKERENRAEHLEIHSEYTQGDPKAEGAEGGRGERKCRCKERWREKESDRRNENE